MVEKTKDIIKMAKDYLERNIEPKDFDKLLENLRMRKEYQLLREVIDKACKPDSKDSTNEKMILLKAFSYFKDYSLAHEERKNKIKECLGKLENLKKEKSPTLVDFEKAFNREQDVEEARKILKEKTCHYDHTFELAKRLKNYNSFNYARRLLELLYPMADAVFSNDEEEQKKQKRLLKQQQAMCTYKDIDLPLIQRLDKALEVLSEGVINAGRSTDIDEILMLSENPETLGIAGAIYKRKWEAEGRKDDLEKSLKYYNEGHRCDMILVNHEEIAAAGIRSPEGELDVTVSIQPGHKHGYPGINAAFVMDLLDNIEHEKARTDEATTIRKELISYLTSLIRVPKDKLDKNAQYGEWWVKMTIVEAYIGLKDYEKARDILVDASTTSDWEFQASAKQLVQLLKLQGKEIMVQNEDVKKMLNILFKDRPKASDNISRGKIGLALSGGGFRASYYHIGVLAKLAELDLLRHVEVISGVSGGSIIAAYYYLEARLHLQSNADKEIKPEDYIEIVKRVAKRFHEGTCKNVILRIFSNMICNLKMIFCPNYSRSVRVGELYEKLLYNRVEDGEQDDSRWLSELYIEPKGEKLTFNPKVDNWLRENKIPALVINATSLNTGNNWQFTASWMGEPPPSSTIQLDGKTRLRRTYYYEAPTPHKKMRLGMAVSASTCVPGLFKPITLEKLYQDYSVRLVDGGVYDNQGISSLLDQDCNVLLISDACGQLDSKKTICSWFLKPLFRSNMVTMERVRGSQFDEMEIRTRTGLVKASMTVHLKKELGLKNVDWIACPDPSPLNNTDTHTSYHIIKPIQASLADMRTNLDSFSDKEAYALMTSGYLMTGKAAEKDLKEVIGNKSLNITEKWPFLAVEETMKGEKKDEKKDKDYKQLKRILNIAKKGAFKSFMLRPLSSTAALLFVMMFIAFGVFLYTKVASELTFLSRSGVLILLVVFIWLMLGLLLFLFNKIFLDAGRVENQVDINQK